MANMANTGLNGMWESPVDSTKADGYLGHHNEINLQNIFHESPIFTGEWTDDDSLDEYSEVMSVLNTENLDYPGLDMNYFKNIPAEDPNAPHKDMENMPEEDSTANWKVPNPTNADEDTPHSPEMKGPAPDDYQDDHKSVSFGDGEGSDLSFLEASKTQGMSKFYDLTKGQGPAA